MTEKDDLIENPEVTLRIQVGEATNEVGLTLAGIIEEGGEVVDRCDYVEEPIVDHVNENYPVEIQPKE